MVFGVGYFQSVTKVRKIFLIGIDKFHMTVKGLFEIHNLLKSDIPLTLFRGG